MHWQNGVAPEQIFTEIDGLERKINQFLLAMQVMDNARMRKKDVSAIKYFATDDREFWIPKGFPQIVDIILKHEQGEQCVGYVLGHGFDCIPLRMTSSPVSLPSTLPRVSLERERLIGIFTSAENFSGPYLVEHQLRNYFLIMKESCDEKTGMGILKPDFYNDLKKVRDFVSHARCERKPTMSFILEKFPELKVIDGENDKEYIQLDRAQSSHINFIWKYRDDAYFWVKKQLAHLSKPNNNF